MIIDGHTRVCGVIGSPVEHTMSPAIHNALAERLSHNLVYVPFHVQTGEVAAAVKGAYALNVLGIIRICRVYTAPCAARESG